MSLARGMRSELNDRREEPIVVAFHMALEEGLDLLGGGHRC